MNWRMSRRIVGVLVVCALSGSLLAAQGDRSQGAAHAAHRVQGGFPDHAEVEHEHSIITIPVILNGDTEPSEVLKLDAYMRLNREEPVRNGLGYRQFEFIIDAWELHGYSKVLDAYITFKLSDTVKPKSLGVALQKNKDYPAMIVYNAIYDIYLDDVKVGENLAGVAFATGVMEIPPRNITVAFHKPFGFGRTKDGKKTSSTKFHDPSCSGQPCPCTWEWCAGPGSCEDMESISAKAFEAGATKAKGYRVKRQERPRLGGAASPGAPSAPKKKPN
ncbi:MAG TPA: hypothetical protein VKK31_15635 [Thermoanaerobaculia bacterium]|nr:hypothetical protein [Thermoanaerobaculia bacterium]